jgi:hypothetical protein
MAKNRLVEVQLLVTGLLTSENPPREKRVIVVEGDIIIETDYALYYQVEFDDIHNQPHLFDQFVSNKWLPETPTSLMTMRVDRRSKLYGLMITYKSERYLIIQYEDNNRSRQICFRSVR